MWGNFFRTGKTVLPKLKYVLWGTEDGLAKIPSVIYTNSKGNKVVKPFKNRLVYEESGLTLKQVATIDYPAGKRQTIELCKALSTEGSSVSGSVKGSFIQDAKGETHFVTLG